MNKMSPLNNFGERIILILSCVSVLNVQIVLCGCRRTNPEWHDKNEDFLSAPIVSIVSGIHYTLFFQFVCN